LGSKILVVDDDPAIRDALEEALRDSGYDVHSAEHGKAALDLLLHGLRPKVILLDLMMPVMNGFDFLVICRQTPECRDTPVIVVSAHPSVQQGLGGVFRKFQKPVALAPLLEAIEVAVSA
jgi:two-component system chemotaxis response regulator CheY